MLEMVGSVVITTVLGWAPLSSAQWIPALDARPEAIITGGALLLIASVLRRSLVARRTRKSRQPEETVAERRYYPVGVEVAKRAEGV